MQKTLDLALGARFILYTEVLQPNKKLKGDVMKEYYTAGELAKMSGVSYKTIRYYVEKGLLAADYETDAGYRMFGISVVEKLQRILMLKYLNFSIEEIEKMLEEEDSASAFEKQEKLLLAEKEHLEQVLEAVREIQQLSKEEQWEKMMQIIRLTTQKEEIIKQYKESHNLQTRINIHAYSTAKVNWFDWILERLDLRPGMKILEIGCGTGQLWTSVCEKLPNNLTIYMTDNSEGMIDEAKRRIAKCGECFARKNIRFVFASKDANAFSVADLIKEDMTTGAGVFDRIIANHMLYHVSDKSRPTLLKYCAALLTDEGMFAASTIGQTHLCQLHELVNKFDNRMQMPGWMSEGFELENGGAQLEPWFDRVTMEEQENDLLVPDPEAIYQYVISLPGDLKQKIAAKEKEFRAYLEKQISTEHPFFIHKSTGIFRAYKKRL